MSRPGGTVEPRFLDLLDGLGQHQVASPGLEQGAELLGRALGHATAPAHLRELLQDPPRACVLSPVGEVLGTAALDSCRFRLVKADGSHPGTHDGALSEAQRLGACCVVRDDDAVHVFLPGRVAPTAYKVGGPKRRDLPDPVPEPAPAAAAPRAAEDDEAARILAAERRAAMRGHAPHIGP